MFPYSAQRGYDGMNLIEEAVIIEVLGIRMYAFGACVALGVLFAVISLCVTGRHLSFKKGTALLTAVISILSGILCSRVAFCLLNKELGHMTPLSFWPQVSGGGWSMFGLIGGVLIGGYISARIMKEDTGKVLDAVSLSVLPMIAAERMGESRIEDFDISRPLDSAFLKDSFLAVGGDEPCLATYYIAAAVAVLLFIILAVRMSHRERSGNIANVFLLLFGAASIITESLRYDRFLSVSFVGLQQIAAALTLAAGVVFAIVRGDRKPALWTAAAVSLVLMVGAVIGLEFALDRTTWNKIIIYVAMVLIVAIPVILGMKLLKTHNNKKAE